MEVYAAALTLISAALIVWTGQRNGFVGAATISTESDLESSNTMMQPITTEQPADTNELNSASIQTTQRTISTVQYTATTTQSANTTTQSATTTTVSTISIANSIAAATVSTARSAEAITGADGTTTSTKATAVKSTAELFHVTMIVMIVVLGFIIVFSVSCGLCVIFGIDVGCPIPCCGGGGKAKNPAKYASGMKLKRSTRPDHMSSQRLNYAEEFHEVEVKSYSVKGQTDAPLGVDNISFEF